ncbi:Peptidase S24-like domain protein [Synechococcus sp. PCC 7335]|uniref:LexA family protein n=1 Tax=Synechococcus sp. (strain ATCC 29403 / PCC 7335) TaxID=91464 RepID=UPI00017EC0C0|nr:translesion error-prone DNA polymerase V autoproteolytic subunit [Synechococcus sp. PCC 7335]EDX82742.1 Peptidase S24-like domain protein [Synechococcus sp. PCC 7335]
MIVSEALRLIPYRSHLLPLYSCPVSAGFPSPATDHLDGHINLNEHLIPHPSATFLVRADGWSMVGEGIHHEDLLIVDRSEEPRHGRVVVAAIDGELTVKKLCQKEQQTFLMAANPDYPSIELGEDADVRIWGVVIHIIRSMR